MTDPIITQLADNKVYVAGLHQPLEDILASIQVHHKAHADAMKVTIEIVKRYHKEHFDQKKFNYYDDNLQMRQL